MKSYIKTITLLAHNKDIVNLMTEKKIETLKVHYKEGLDETKSSIRSQFNNIGFKIGGKKS